jgi:hypothetical protein
VLQQLVPIVREGLSPALPEVADHGFILTVSIHVCEHNVTGLGSLVLQMIPTQAEVDDRRAEQAKQEGFGMGAPLEPHDGD